MRRTGLSARDRHVLEIGFGGGATLSWLRQQGAVVYGQEVVESNRAVARGLGIPPDHLKADLSEFEGVFFDLVLYLDVFEHILDARAQLNLLAKLTRKGCRALLVLPVADSLSRQLLGGLWPHDLPDHWIFYSCQGLTSLWAEFGWHEVKRFYPWKFISADTVARHLSLKAGRPIPTFGLGQVGFWLNFGERGFVFERR